MNRAPTKSKINSSMIVYLLAALIFGLTLSSCTDEERTTLSVPGLEIAVSGHGELTGKELSEQRQVFYFDDMHFCIARDMLVLESRVYSLKELSEISIQSGVVFARGRELEGRPTTSDESSFLDPAMTYLTSLAGVQVLVVAHEASGVAETITGHQTLVVDGTKLIAKDGKLFVDGRLTASLSHIDAIVVRQGQVTVINR